ncbi:CBS domain-containing protein [Streptomyces sp. SP18ES09]|uniref:CBS domain-containing protein n=1 Tax=Streptomyces sp. SP18ES09 TaxID=3002532 RepID=UPI002E798F3F|nr:CBS domain-containing protein [Streptomyces sp. SP18ES09]MEE1816745.1 CBS domain-containing protein [Streptomyces sp. SP18ES09]
MRHRTVSEVLTRDVVTVPPTAPFKEVVRLLAAHEVSAVPVVDGERRPSTAWPRSRPPARPRHN